MNYHFKPQGRKGELLSQLQQIDSDIKSEVKTLQKLKLQAEFYEDKNKPPPVDKLSLADEIMNELISDPYKPKYDPLRAVINEPPPYRSPPKQYIPQPVKLSPQRQNNLMNERELQKVKLQNQKHEGLFPNSSDHNRVRSFGKQPAQLMPQKDRINVVPTNNNNNYSISPVSPKKANSPGIERKFDPAYNPFVKDDTLQKQRKEEKNREYLRELEEQRLAQERLKKERLREERERKVEVYADFRPAAAVKGEVVEKPLIMKRADPNNRQPRVEVMGNFSQFDKNLIRSKVIELKSKFKKGKIIYQEYERELNNFRKHYPGDFEEIMEEESGYAKKENSPVKENNVEVVRAEEQLQPKIESKERIQERNEHVYPIRNESVNYSQFMPSMVQQPTIPQSNMSHQYPQGGYGMMPPPSYFQGAPPGQYMELLKKMFDFCFKEVREVRSEQSAQNHVLHQTLNKFLVMNTQANLMSQQIPPISAAPRDFYSDAKQHRDYFEKEASARRNPVPQSAESLANIPFGESDTSESYDRSLSGIASKIPLNVQQGSRKAEKNKGASQLQQFYSRKYRVKELGKFNIVVDATLSEKEIPSTSSYLRAKNAKEEFKFRFEEDLSELKRLQLEKGTKKFAGKVAGNSQYAEKRERREPEPRLVGNAAEPNPAKKAETVLGNPFLKKYVSNEDNIMTFNQEELQMRSPTGYSPLSRKEILEQEQYQTQPRVREQQASSLVEEYEQRLAQPSKVLNFIKANNQLLSKYDRTEQSKKDFISVQSQVRDSRDYFTNNQISPVKPPDNYEESLETIRSDFESVRQSQKQSQTKARKAQDQVRGQQESRRNAEEGTMGYSQTVESVQESSSKLRKPPIAKRRSVGKKKESSLSRSRQHESVLSVGDSSALVPHKFDSNVYESNYQESRDPAVRPNAALRLGVPQERQIEIQINPPTIITPKGSMSVDVQLSEQGKIPSAKSITGNGKWKSLDQARKLAKQGRIKVLDDSKDYRSVEQKFSELQSFMTKRDDSKLVPEAVAGQQRSRSKQRKQQGQGSKRNILKLLQQLQDDNQQDYKQQFQSYRQESQHYQFQ